MNQDSLYDLYVVKKQSAARIAKKFKCSQNKINYWLAKYHIEKRTISDAIYQLRNPGGDPFVFHTPVTRQEAILYGLGLGLYWGEGLKRGKGGVRLGNTDVRLVKKFIEFLDKVFGVKKDKLHFGLQVFSDISPITALSYWKHELHVNESQFYKVIVSKVRGKGTYKYKSQYGVLMIYFNNIKLKALICSQIDNIQ